MTSLLGPKRTKMTTSATAKKVSKQETLVHDYETSLTYNEILMDLNVFVETSRAKNLVWTINNPAIPEIDGKRVDRDLMLSFRRQLRARFKSHGASLETLSNKIKTSKTTRVVPLKPEGYINKLSYPVVISDVVKEFFKNVNLGNTLGPTYVARKFDEGFFVDGRDAEALREVHRRAFPGQNLSEEDLANASVQSRLPLLLDNNIANGSILSHLFSLYTKVNKLKSSKASRIHTSPEFVDFILKQKVRYVVHGVDLLAGLDLKPLEPRIQELVKLLEDGEERFKQAKHNCDSWNKADQRPPKDPSSKIYVLYHNNTYHALQVEYTEAQAALKKYKKDASELLCKLFKTDKESSNPVSTLKKLLNRDKTFGEIIAQYAPSKNNGAAFIQEGEQADGTDHWGYSMTMVGVIKSYMMVPPIMLSLLDKQYSTVIQQEDVIKATAALEAELGGLSKVH